MLSYCIRFNDKQREEFHQRHKRQQQQIAQVNAPWAEDRAAGQEAQALSPQGSAFFFRLTRPAYCGLWHQFWSTCLENLVSVCKFSKLLAVIGSAELHGGAGAGPGEQAGWVGDTSLPAHARGGGTAFDFSATAKTNRCACRRVCSAYLKHVLLPTPGLARQRKAVHPNLACLYHFVS